VEGNLFEGTNYNFILEYSNGGYGNNMRAKNNRLKPYTKYSAGSAYGYVQGGKSWKEWSNNCTYHSENTDQVCKREIVKMRTIND